MRMLAGSSAVVSGSARATSKQLANRGFVGLSRAGAKHTAHLIPVLVIEKRHRERAVPLRPDGLGKSGLVSMLFAVIRKNRFVSRDKPAHQNQVAVIVEIDTDDLQSLRPILLGQLVEHGIFIAAGLAPRRPERHEQRFPTMLLDQFLITLCIDDFGV